MTGPGSTTGPILTTGPIPVVSGGNGAEPGRASRALAVVMGRVLVALRAVAVLLTLFYFAVWPWYAHQPLAIAVALLTALWGIVFCYVGLWRGLCRPLAAANIVVAIALAVTARHWLPPASVGDSGNFVFLASINGAVVAIWVFPPAVAAALLSVLAGAVLFGGWGQFPQVVVEAAMLLIIPGLLGTALGRLRRIARTADLRWSNVAARHRAEAVVLAVARDRRERERILHDTVLNTLTGIAWGGGRDVELARRRCAESMATVHGLLNRDDESGPRIDERMTGAVRAARDRGLEVALDVRWRPGPGDDPPPVVAAAFAGAVGEALANVERHAGTRRASVVLDGGQGLVTAWVSDSGRGFHADQVGTDRLGLRESIVGRLADVAGTAHVDSAPGRGTTIVLQWRAPVVVSGPTVRPMLGPDRRGADAIAADLRHAYAAGLRLAVGQVGGMWLLFMLVPLTITIGWVRSMAGAVAIWLGTAALIAVVVRRARLRPITGPEAFAVLVAVLGIAVAGTANTRGADLVRIANWPLIVLPMLLALVTASRPSREWIAALVVTLVAMVSMVLLRGQTEPLVLARLSSLVYGVCGVQIITAMLGPLLRRTAETTAQAMAAEAEVAARVDATTMIRRERTRWLRTVEWDVLPLLDELAGGRSDPRDPLIRSRCAVRAAAVRRMITGGGPSSALADLDPVVAAAESGGITVQVQLDGDLRLAPSDVRAALADRVGEVLAAIPGGRVIMTVLWRPEGGSVFVSLPWPDERLRLPFPGPVDARGIGVGVELDDGRLSLELTWAVSAPTGDGDSNSGGVGVSRTGSKRI